MHAKVQARGQQNDRKGRSGQGKVQRRGGAKVEQKGSEAGDSIADGPDDTADGAGGGGGKSYLPYSGSYNGPLRSQDYQSNIISDTLETLHRRDRVRRVQANAHSGYVPRFSAANNASGDGHDWAEEDGSRQQG